MLPRRARLDRKSLSLVIRKGRGVMFKAGSLRYLRPPQASRVAGGRFGVVIPSAVIKKSVTRHLLRRRLYRLLGQSILYRQDIWLVVMVKLDISRMCFTDLAAIINPPLKQLGL